MLLSGIDEHQLLGMHEMGRELKAGWAMRTAVVVERVKLTPDPDPDPDP